MTGNQIVQLAMSRLNYTNNVGGTDNGLNQEEVARAYPLLLVVLYDIQRILGKPIEMPLALADDVPLSDDVCNRVVTPGVAMHLAQGINDADNYNRYAVEYSEMRKTIVPAAVTIADAQPNVGTA